jgi:S-adenosylmethionine synthetase
LVCLLGETTKKGPAISYEQIARDVCKEVGYDEESKGLDYKNMTVLVNVES